MTAGNNKMISVPVFFHRPGSRRLASGRIRQNVRNFVPLTPRSSGTPLRVMCGAGWEEQLTRHNHLMSVEISTQRVISAQAVELRTFL